MSDPATMTELDGCRLAHRDVTTNGVRLHLVEAGPADGPPVVEYLNGSQYRSGGTD